MVVSSTSMIRIIHVVLNMGRSAMNRRGNVGEFYVVWIVAHPVYDLLNGDSVVDP